MTNILCNTKKRAIKCYVWPMDGKDYQRGSIEKDGNRQRNSETIQDEENTVSDIL